MSSRTAVSPPDEPPSAAQPASPFDRVRARTAVLMMIGVAVAVEGLRAVAFPRVAEEAWDAGAGVAFHLAVGALLLAYLRWRGVSPRRLVGRVPRGWRTWGLVALAIPLLALSLGTAVLQVSLLEALAPEWAAKMHEVGGEGAATSTAAVLSAALIGLLAAGLEELLFRGVLLARWERRWGARRAVFATSLAFAVLHVDLLGAFVFGAVMALLYLRTRSLWVPFACHAANNLAIALSDLADGSGAALDPTVPAPSLADWKGGLLLIALALPALAWFARAAWPRDWRLPYVDDDGVA